MATDGPEIKLTASCFACKFEKSEQDYDPESEEMDHDVYCTEPSIGKKYIASSNWRTPKWCPLLERNIKEFVATKL